MRVQTEWDGGSPTSKSIQSMGKNFKGDGNFGILKTDKTFVIEDTVNHERDSFCRSLDKSIKQASNDIHSILFEHVAVHA
ncbi:hypothetical protein TNCV_1376151 [Trichonephila clavipes]|nr:hypothetical protein TNCV_1376151 [Trichonephila clavipes]